MPLAVDFGTSNTVIARWHPGTHTTEMIRVEGLSRDFTYAIPGAARQFEASVIPSLIHYGEGDATMLGQQIVEQGLAADSATFCELKLEMMNGGAFCRRVHGNSLSARRVATDFLRRILPIATNQAARGEHDLVLTVPVGAFEGYQDWLLDAARPAFPGTVRCLDEATACILGYQQAGEGDDPYLVVDFGGGTLDVSIASVPATGAGTAPARILGRAGEVIGGANIDRWMLEQMVADGAVNDDDIRAVGVPLIRAIEQAKIDLSSGLDEVEITQFNNHTNHTVSYTFERSALSQILNRHKLPHLVSRTVRRALDAARRSCSLTHSDIKAVLMVGGTSLLQEVADSVRHQLDAPLRYDQPFTAVAAGACRYAGEDLNPTLVHEYCIRSWNPGSLGYEFVPVIERGTRYPTNGPAKAIFATTGVAVSDVVGLVVWERSQMSCPGVGWVVGSDGRMRQCQMDDRRVAAERELNPRARELIHAVPDCTTMQTRRFIIEFGVDRQKRLVVSIRDTFHGNESYILDSQGQRVPLPVREFPLVRL